MSWDNDSVIQLIEAYNLKEILWNPQNRNYYNRLLKKDAWDELETELQRPSEEIKKKVDYLLSALHRERQKIAKSKTTNRSRLAADNVYQSTWFAHVEFLRNRNTPRAGRLYTENEAEKITEDNDIVENEHFEDSAACESQEPGTQASGGQESATQPSGGQECATQASGTQAPGGRASETQASGSQASGTQAPGGRASETQASGSQASGTQAPGTQPNSAAFKSPVPKKQKKKRPPQNDPIMNEALQLMRSSSQAATSAASAVSTQPFADRYQIYANYLASKFRTYTQTTFLTVEHRINEISYYADSGQYEWASGYGGSTPNSHTPTPPSTNREWETGHGGYQFSNSHTPIPPNQDQSTSDNLTPTPPNQVEANESDSRDTDDFSDLIRFNL